MKVLDDIPKCFDNDNKGKSGEHSLNLFDVQSPKRPYDEEEDTFNEDGNSVVTSDDYNIIVEDEVAGVITQIEDNVTSEGNAQVNQNGEGSSDSLETSPIMRRSTRQKVMPAKFSDFVVNSGVRYGLEKYIDLRCLIALSVQNGWPLFQLDVNNAFLYGDLKEEVYMELPRGYYDKNETKVYKLVKYLYGLKQAPSKNDIFIAMLVYVDDIVVTGNNKDEIDKFKRFLSSKFMIKDLGLLKYFLGIEVLENENGLCLSQRKYYLELLNEYGLLACKPAATPLQQNVVLSYEESESDKFLSNMTEYQKIVGKLIYLSITKTDISYVVHYLRVLRYLKNAPGTGVQFCKGNSLSLHAFSYADWA
ncbi:ribonuclease H-like domain-containing protein [Tanacetum coccineum]|uniref:Ribonuclease H-like domain-containing protein n=1 Tax=Tanacetum coccineum TaxID=301880 RepID=A0ABQ4WTD1_9ASTR